MDYNQQDDYGVSGLITKYNTSEDFILLSDFNIAANRYSNILYTTKNFFEKVFRRRFRKDRDGIKELCLSRVFPLIEAIYNDDVFFELRNELTSFMCIPKKNTHVNLLKMQIPHDFKSLKHYLINLGLRYNY
jgi:hypothetical protein